MSIVKEVKWESGQEPVAGMFIMPRLPFLPEVVVNEKDGVKYSYKRLVKYYKGAGNFKHGVQIGVTPAGEPVTLYADVRIGKIKNATSQSDNLANVTF